MAEDQSARFKARPGQEVPFESFGDAFKRHKAAGRAEFPWRGKTYSTKTAQEQGREIGARASGSGRGTAGGMGASDRVVLRPDPYADTSRVMEGVAAKQREMSRPGRDAIENVYPETALIPATRLGPLAARAAQAIRGAMASSGRAKEEPAQPPELGQGVWRSAREKAEAEARNTKPPELGQGVWRSAREKAEAEARNAKPRVQVEGTKGGVYRGTKEEAASEAKPEFRSRTADRMDERDMEFKKGGKTKTYAKGGSVRGAGIAQRGVRKCKVY